VPIRKISRIAVTALEDIKARDITVFDVRKLTSLYDTLIIATAESNRQVKALAHHVSRDKLKEAGATILGVEGEETGEWAWSMPARSSSISCSRRYAHYNLKSSGRRASLAGADEASDRAAA
jgi:ribosome silencing factor RsfS/YbeB/iojap